VGGKLKIFSSIQDGAEVAVGSTTPKQRNGVSIGIDFSGEQGDGCVGWLADDFG